MNVRQDWGWGKTLKGETDRQWESDRLYETEGCMLNVRMWVRYDRLGRKNVVQHGEMKEGVRDKKRIKLCEGG